MGDCSSSVGSGSQLNQTNMQLILALSGSIGRSAQRCTGCNTWCTSAALTQDESKQTWMSRL
eukprot:7470816-Pyramimonas_sp.AAC.1